MGVLVVPGTSLTVDLLQCVTWDQFFTGSAQASLVGVDRALILCHLLVGTWHSQGCSPKFFPATWRVSFRVEPAM